MGNGNWPCIDFLGLLIFKHKAKTNLPSFGIERRPLSGQNFQTRLSSRVDKSNVLNDYTIYVCTSEMGRETV